MPTTPSLSPIRINQLEIRNRIARSAHGIPMPWSDDPRQLIDYHAARARDGVGLIILGNTGVHSSALSNIPVHDDLVIPGYRRLSAELHELGAAVMQQIGHRGAIAPGTDGGPPWAPSDIPSPSLGKVPRPMTKAMIDELVEAFAAAARRVRDGGLDGVELGACHGYLFSQFLSPLTNRRDDEYGGSLENRARFLREVVVAIRGEVGPDFAIGVRLSAEERATGGFTVDDTRDIALGLEPLVDFVSVSNGSYYDEYEMNAIMETPYSYQLPTVRQVTRALSVPTMVVGRIMTLAQADEIIAAGDADMVSMVRALIADSEVITKTIEGRGEQIRPCIGTSQGCIEGSGHLAGEFQCIINPDAGHEGEVRLRRAASTARRVLIAGGGPAGLETARSAALRGHHVTLMELRGHLGGQMAVAAAAPRRGDIGGFVNWQESELARLGVDVRLRQPVDPDVVADLDPDVVVVATGSEPRDDGSQTRRPQQLPGIGLAHVYSSWDLFGFGGRAQVGDRVVLYDDTGWHDALAVADELVERGVAFTYVTSKMHVGSRIVARELLLTPILDRLAGAGVEVITEAALSEITSDSVEIVRRFHFSETRPADTVIFVGVNRPADDLALVLDDYRGEIHVIGDAAGGDYSISKAVHAGAAVGNAL